MSFESPRRLRESLAGLGFRPGEDLPTQGTTWTRPDRPDLPAVLVPHERLVGVIGYDDLLASAHERLAWIESRLEQAKPRRVARMGDEFEMRIVHRSTQGGRLPLESAPRVVEAFLQARQACDSTGGEAVSADMDAARAWLDRCSPEYRAVLEKALHADVEAMGDGFLDSWHETRLRTQVAVGAFIEAETQVWVDPCPTWDELRPHGVTPDSPRDVRMRARYEAGRQQYREDWTQWDITRFTEMIREEEDDSTIYRAMRRWVMRERGLL